LGFSGCLPPSLLRETVMTFHLLFPVTDHVSRSLLQKEVNQRNLDRHFLEPFLRYYDHERPGDALEPTDLRSLYEKYGFWADRLYALWREADDPTPLTTLGMWTDSRRNPRFQYWCLVISISVAIVFGAIAVGLGVVQIWMSYSAWVDDPSKPQCWYKHPR
jgi:hypothetical protein